MPIKALLLASLLASATHALEYSELTPDGGQRYGHDSGPGGYHRAVASGRGSVRGSFGHKEPRTGQSFHTEYSAGRAGFIAKGAHLTRRGEPLELNARLEDPNSRIPPPSKEYDFSWSNNNQSRREAADQFGNVRGRYTYKDDVGIQRTVDYMAGRLTGFLVINDVPDGPSKGRDHERTFYRPSRPRAPPGPAGTRGYQSTKLNADGSYQFTHSSPLQRRTERRDALGRVLGEYTFVDDRGRHHRVQYEAGPGIGYRITSRDPPIPGAPSLPRPPGASTLGPPGSSPTLRPPSFGSPTLRPPGSASLRPPGSSTLRPPGSSTLRPIGSPGLRPPGVTSLRPPGSTFGPPTIPLKPFAALHHSERTEQQDFDSNQGSSEHQDGGPGTLSPDLVNERRDALNNRQDSRESTWESSSPSSIPTETPDIIATTPLTPLDDLDVSEAGGDDEAPRPGVTFVSEQPGLEVVELSTDEARGDERWQANPSSQPDGDLPPWLSDMQEDPQAVNEQLRRGGTTSVEDSNERWTAAQSFHDERVQPTHQPEWGDRIGTRTWSWINERDDFRDARRPGQESSGERTRGGVGDSDRSSAEASVPRGWRAPRVHDGGSPVTTNDLRFLRTRVSFKTPRLAQVVALN